jgi:hypothetical protein
LTAFLSPARLYLARAITSRASISNIKRPSCNLDYANLPTIDRHGQCVQVYQIGVEL